MEEWNTVHHGKSGFFQSCLDSQISMESAKAQLLKLLQEHKTKATCPLAGNSVGMDRKFLERCMPKLSEHLHYRTVDVSTLKELCRRWSPSTYDCMPVKKSTHRALDDIVESIEELKFYKKNWIQI